MEVFEKTRLESKIKASMGVQHIRVLIENAEADLERAHAALADLPAPIRFATLAQAEGELEELLQKEARLIEQATRAAEAELRAERVAAIQDEAAPHLAAAAKALELARAALRAAAALESQARANGGRVFGEAFDASTIKAMLPILEFNDAGSYWLLRRCDAA